MEVGTIDILEEIPEEKKRRSTGIGGSNTPGGGGRGPGGDDGDDGAQPGGNYVGEEQTRPGISRILTGFLLVVVGMTFGGLISAYVVLATNKAAEWHPFNLPIQVWISTAIIIASSLTYQLAKSAADRDDHPRLRLWLIVTTALGAAFVSSQLLAWLGLRSRGLYMEGNPYAGFFYILTGIHAVHVAGGIAALGSLLIRSWHPAHSQAAVLRRASLAEVVGWYWHFMGGLWIVLLVLLGFWK